MTSKKEEKPMGMVIEQLQEFARMYDLVDTVANKWALAHGLHGGDLSWVGQVKDGDGGIAVGLEGVEPWQYGDALSYEFTLPIECFQDEFDWGALAERVKRKREEEKARKATEQAASIEEKERSQLQRLLVKYRRKK